MQRGQSTYGAYVRRAGKQVHLGSHATANPNPNPNPNPNQFAIAGLILYAVDKLMELWQLAVQVSK